MAEPVKLEPFVSTATIYKPGAGHPFPPGTPVHLHPDHAAALRDMKLEAEPKADAKAPTAESNAPQDAPQAAPAVSNKSKA